MGKGRIENLRALTSEEAREIGRKGGLASVRARRDKRTLQEALKALLQAPADDDGNSGMELMATVLFQKALSGDVRAITEIRDTTDGKPADRLLASTEGEVTFRWGQPLDEVPKEERERVVTMRDPPGVLKEPASFPEGNESLPLPKPTPLPERKIMQEERTVKNEAARMPFGYGYAGDELPPNDLQRLQERIQKYGRL